MSDATSSKAAKTIKIVLCDDHPGVLRGLANILNKADDMTVVGLAATGDEAIAMTIEHKPDIVLMDIGLPEMDGREATRRLLEQSPGTRVMMLTSFGGRDHVEGSFKAGAIAYLQKDSTPGEIREKVRAAMKGEIDPESAQED
jgi:DNA-binding NarL/FixJ family response regulator